MRQPTHCARNREQHGEHRGGEAEGAQDDARIEVDVRVKLALDEVGVRKGGLLQHARHFQQRVVLDAKAGEGLVEAGLDDLGRQQAEETAIILARLSPMKLVSSPMLRCQQTAGFLSAKWDNANVNVESLVTEIPSPDGYELGERIEWLRNAMAAHGAN